MIEHLFHGQLGLDWIVALMDIENRYFRDRELTGRNQYRQCRDLMMAAEKPRQGEGETAKAIAARFFRRVLGELARQGADLSRPKFSQAQTAGVNLLDRFERGHFLQAYYAEWEHGRRAGRFRSSFGFEKDNAKCHPPERTFFDRQNFHEAMRELEERRPLTCTIVEMALFGDFENLPAIAKELGLDHVKVTTKYGTAVQFLRNRLLHTVRVRLNSEDDQERALAKAAELRFAQDMAGARLIEEPTRANPALPADKSGTKAAKVLDPEQWISTEELVARDCQTIQKLSHYFGAEAEELAQEVATKLLERRFVAKQPDGNYVRIYRRMLKDKWLEAKRKQGAAKRGGEAPLLLSQLQDEFGLFV